MRTYMSSAKWLLLQVKSSQELRAIENLEFQGGQCYCPMITVDKIVAGKRSRVKEALFPGYVFIYSEPESDGLSYTSIRSTRGVYKLVSFGATPVTVSEALIENIKQREGLSANVYSHAPQKGDKLRILEGPFKGLDGVFSQADGIRRSLVLINMLHQNVSVSIPNEAIDQKTG